MLDNVIVLKHLIDADFPKHSFYTFYVMMSGAKMLLHHDVVTATNSWQPGYLHIIYKHYKHTFYIDIWGFKGLPNNLILRF